jgi:hypothetical protein
VALGGDIEAALPDEIYLTEPSTPELNDTADQTTCGICNYTNNNTTGPWTWWWVSQSSSRPSKPSNPTCPAGPRP